MTSPELESALRRLARAKRLAAVFAGTTLALVLLTVASLEPGGDSAVRLDDEGRREAIAELVSRGSGVWDSHVDPDVGRVLQPDLDGRDLLGEPVSSNRFGMRERDFGPKPAGTTRVVLLGDSFVFGHGTAAEVRFGVFLERWISERSGAEVEVLHIGISSWNILAECAYLRRQLSLVEPDLVVQLVFNNDLDDVRGVRGFGERASFAPAHRRRADGVIARDALQRAAGIEVANLLLYGLDWESRERYRLAAEALGGLADAVEEGGGRYLCLAMWLYFQPLVEERLATELSDDELAYVSDAFLSDRTLWSGPQNNHWNAEGSERIAKLVYALVRERGLLPGLELPAWSEAEAEIDAIDGAGRREAADRGPLGRRLALHGVGKRLDFTQLDGRSASWINGGLDGEGYAAPYASLVLASDGGRELVVRGERLGRPELVNARTRVFADEVALGVIELEGERTFEERFPIPPAIADRGHVSVRFEATDYVYRGELLDRCVTLRLAEVAIE